MKSKIVLASFVDTIISFIAVSALSIQFVSLMNTYLAESYVDGVLVVDFAEFNATYISMLLNLILSSIILYVLFNTCITTVSMLVTKGRTIGMYLARIKVTDKAGYQLDYLEIIKRQLLFSCLLNYLTLYLFGIIDIIRLVFNKERLIDKFTKTMIMEIQEEQ